MIPKIIHYCWFGRNEYPEKIKYCLKSWEVLKGYKLMLWNEDSFDVNSIPFTKEAYEKGKYAFVSDYVRIYALVHYGGIYLDTDIEVVNDFDAILDNKVVLGQDEEGSLTAFMASEKNHVFFNDILKMYDGMHFIKQDGSLETTVNNKWIEEKLRTRGYRSENIYQMLSDGIIVYPDDFFHAKSLIDGKYHITSNTYCIHHHTLTWITWRTKAIRFLRMKIIAPLIGRNNYSRLTVKIRGGQSK